MVSSRVLKTALPVIAAALALHVVFLHLRRERRANEEVSKATLARQKVTAGYDAAARSIITGKPATAIAFLHSHPSVSAERLSHLLDLAADNGNLTVIDELLARGCNVKDRNVGGSALWSAALRRQTPAARKLLALGANPNFVGGWGMTPLIWATVHGDTGLVRELLAHGADMEARAKYIRHPRVTSTGSLYTGPADDEPDSTALILASYFGYPEVAGVLLEYGANPSARGSDGMSALRAAQIRGHKDIAVLIRKRISALERKRQ